jgi:hypothetical protein
MRVAHKFTNSFTDGPVQHRRFPLNFLMLEPIFMKLGMYIMAPEPISAAYFITPSLISLRVCYVYPPNVAR